MSLIRKSPAELSSAEKDSIRLYSGWGGLPARDERGVLYDYYTSPPVAAMTWRLLNAVSPIEKNARIREPSCGSGVFFETAPAPLDLYGVELNPASASIASFLHPSAHISNQSYEAFNFSKDPSLLFDHIIGNIPFGERSLKTAFLDMRKELSLDRYFISRSLDNLKPGGTLALIVHPGVLSNKSGKDWRTSLCLKAQFLGAVKLNSGSFSHTHPLSSPTSFFSGSTPKMSKQDYKCSHPNPSLPWNSPPPFGRKVPTFLSILNTS